MTTKYYYCWYYIFEFLHGDIVSQLNIKSSCKMLNTFEIIDLYEIDYKYKNKLNDKILSKFKFVKYLDASENKNITDNGIMHLNLHTLNVESNSNITNNGIKHMNLHTLYMADNIGITDAGIQHMNIYILYIGCTNITDTGIQYMTNVFWLNASGNNKITNYGIRKMNLICLHADGNPNITDEGIKHMNISYLTVCDNPNITEEGIQHMNLLVLRAWNNPNISHNTERNIRNKNKITYSFFNYLIQKIEWDM